MQGETEQSVSKAVRAKHGELLRQLQGVEEEALRLQARRGEIQRQLEDCHAAARLFGIALDDPPPRGAARVTPNGNGNREKLSVRLMVLEELKQAFPHPVRAGTVRKLLQEKGINVHEKTVGMTLYRLSLGDRPLSRRSGRLDWYYVPDGEEQPSSGAPHWLARGAHKPRAANNEQGHGE